MRKASITCLLPVGLILVNLINFSNGCCPNPVTPTCDPPTTEAPTKDPPTTAAAPTTTAAPTKAEVDIVIMHPYVDKNETFECPYCARETCHVIMFKKNIFESKYDGGFDSVPGYRVKRSAQAGLSCCCYCAIHSLFGRKCGKITFPRWSGCDDRNCRRHFPFCCSN